MERVAAAIARKDTTEPSLIVIKMHHTKMQAKHTQKEFEHYLFLQYLLTFFLCERPLVG